MKKIGRRRAVMIGKVVHVTQRDAVGLGTELVRSLVSHQLDLSRQAGKVQAREVLMRPLSEPTYVQSEPGFLDLTYRFGVKQFWEAAFIGRRNRVAR